MVTPLSAGVKPLGTSGGRKPLSMKYGAVYARNKKAQMTPFQTLEAKIKRKYQAKIRTYGKKDSGAADRTAFRARMIIERDAKIAEERRNWVKNGTTDSHSDIEELAGPLPILSSIPDNELALMRQIETLQGHLAVVRAANRVSQKVKCESLDSAATRLVFANQIAMLSTRRRTRSTAEPIDPEVIGKDKIVDKAEDGKAGDSKSAPSQRKRAKLTTVPLDKGREKTKAKPQPLLPLIVLTREQYVAFKSLVKASIGMKKIPKWGPNVTKQGKVLTDDTPWTRREGRAIRRNTRNGNRRRWAGWKRKHMALLEMGVRIMTSQGCGRQADEFIEANSGRLKRCMIGLYSGYTSRLQGMDDLEPGASGDQLWNLPLDEEERNIQRREFLQYEQSVQRRANAAAAGAVVAAATPPTALVAKVEGAKIVDLTIDNNAASEAEDQEVDDEVYASDDDPEDPIIDFARQGDAQWMKAAAPIVVGEVSIDLTSDEEAESDYIIESGSEDDGVEEGDDDAGEEEPGDSSTDVDSDDSYTSGFQSDTDDDNNDEGIAGDLLTAKGRMMVKRARMSEPATALCI